MGQTRSGLLDLARELELHSKENQGSLKVLNSTAIRLYWMNSKVSSVVPWQIVHSTVRLVNMLAKCVFKWSPKLPSQEHGPGPALTSGLLFMYRVLDIQKLSLIPSASQVSSSSGLSPIHSTTSHKTQESFSLKAWGLETYFFLSCLCSGEVSCVHHRCSVNPLLVGNIRICMDTEPSLLGLITINTWHLLL